MASINMQVPKNGRIIASYIRKGGVGKTHGVINISCQMALDGKKVLVVDFDPQRNLTQFFLNDKEEYFDGTDTIEGIPTVYDIITERVNIFSTMIPISYVGKRLSGKNIFLKNEIEINLIPGSTMLDQIDAREIEPQTLRRQLNLLRKEYDYIFLDFPPALSNETTELFLCAADYILMPFEINRKTSLLAYFDVIQKYNAVKASSNPHLKILGSYVNKFYGHIKDYQNAQNNFADIKDELQFFDTCISYGHGPTNEFENAGKPLCICAPRSNVAKEYANLVKEIYTRVGDV